MKKPNTQPVAFNTQPIKAFVLQPDLKQGSAIAQRLSQGRTTQTKLAEALALMQALPVELVAHDVAVLRQPHPATLFGTGTVERLRADITNVGAQLVFVNTSLSPIQQRNLERAFKAKVIDRQGLILEIFGARAQTREGKLQVQLAQLSYQKSRLVKAWSHLERQRGGLGKTGGPGETQKELDRRIIDGKIKTLQSELAKVVKNRAVQRQARAAVPFPVVALVGYTNAGKSTLFNRLTEAGVLSADLLFATLDPTMRVLALPTGQKVIVSDTVGFIADLPTDLVAAFRATLEEVIQADVIWHVQDVASSEHEAQKADVLYTLAQLQIGPEKPIINVLNKADLLSEEDQIFWRNKLQQNHHCFISSLTGEGVDELLAQTAQLLQNQHLEKGLVLPVAAGAALAWLHQNSHVLEKTYNESTQNWHLTVRLSPSLWAQFEGRFSYDSY